MAENTAALIVGKKGKIEAHNSTVNIQNQCPQESGGKSTAAAIVGDDGKISSKNSNLNVGTPDEQAAEMTTKLRENVGLSISAEDMIKLVQDLRKKGINRWSDFGDKLVDEKMLKGLLVGMQQKKLLKYWRENFAKF